MLRCTGCAGPARHTWTSPLRPLCSWGLSSPPRRFKLSSFWLASGFGHPGWALVFAAVGLFLESDARPIDGATQPSVDGATGRMETACGIGLFEGGRRGGAVKAAARPEGNLTARDVWVSAEGGGIRAAYWTAVTLETASQQLWRGQLAERVRLMSGVSGGSLGIATGPLRRRFQRSTHGLHPRSFWAPDFLTPLLGGLFFIDIPRLILPTSWVGIHRGDLMEQKIARR